MQKGNHKWLTDFTFNCNFINWISYSIYFHSKIKSPMTCRMTLTMTLPVVVTFSCQIWHERQTNRNQIWFFHPFAFALIFRKDQNETNSSERIESKPNSNLKWPILTKEVRIKAKQRQDKLLQAIPSIEREKLKTVSLFLKNSSNQSPLSDTQFCNQRHQSF